MGAVATRVLAFLALIVLFAGTLTVHAALPLDTARVALIYAIAALQVALVAFGFMGLAGSGTLVRLAAVGTGVWLAILFGFTAMDYLYR